MKTVYLLDIQDNDISPAIYNLLFSGVLIELKGNGLCYELNIEGLLGDFDWEEYDTTQNLDLWNLRLQRTKNGYYDTKAMVKFLANPCYLEEAVHEFIRYLERCDITQNDTVLVKIWW